MHNPPPTNLRFPPPPPLPLPPGLAALHAHLLAQRPNPLYHLHAHPPSLNAYASLLTLTPPHPRLVRAATTPPQSASKDLPALDFIVAVSATPARVPAELRTIYAASPDRLQPIALVASFAAYYSTTCSLLGLDDRPNEANASDITESASGQARPDSDAGDAVSITSTASLPMRIAAMTKSRLSRRVAAPLRHRLAARAVKRTQRTRWLANVPLNRRSQDDFVRAAMGFAPRYLSLVKSSLHRAVFVYLLDEILLRESADLSVPLKQLVCYVLARSAENEVLTAHTAFLANRFGADDRQLAACMDVAFLQQVHRVYKRCQGRVEVSSMATSSSSSVSSPPRSPPPPVENVVKKRRRGSFLADEVRDRVVEKEAHRSAFVKDGKRAFGRSKSLGCQLGRDMDDSSDEEDLEEEVEREGDVCSVVKILPEEDGRRKRFGRLCSEGLVTDMSIDETNSEVSDLDMANAEVVTLAVTDEIAVSTTDGSFFDLVDDPAVPEVSGLNSIDMSMYDGEDDYGYDSEFYGQFTLPIDDDVHDAEDAFSLYEDDIDAPLELDHTVFSEKEVAVLLLAHDVAQASRRNSRRMARYPDASPGPLVTPPRAALIHELFDPEAIMEIVSVISSFHLLQRWTVCYPYRPGSLEAPVRRFMQTPIAHDLCVASVGQRSSSKSSVTLRSRQGRALRLPRHVLVNSR